MIHVHHSQRGEPIFHLKSGDSSYVLSVFHGYLLHLYCGAQVSDDDLEYLLVQIPHDSVVPRPSHTYEENKWFSCDAATFEYPANGCGDFRPSAIAVKMMEAYGNSSTFAGTTATDLRYVSYEIVNGKPQVDKQPAVYASDEEAQTLIITCEDPATKLTVKLYYTAFRDFSAICRRTVIENSCKEQLPLDILRAYSACVDFTSIEPQPQLLHLWGTWARERHIERTPLAHGTVSVSSKRGASSHYHNPFAALVTEETTETHGMAVGLSLIYSGNFEISTDTDPYGTVRLMAGINPSDFTWRLEPGESFVTPEAVLVFSDEGLGKMSRTFHKLYRSHLCRGEWRDKTRPVLVNSWEATYFDFDDEKILSIAKEAADCGIEMFVLDDGWFGQRNSDKSSLGDWFVNEDKIRCGMKKLAEQINALGLKFGLWFEPEMVSPVSELYKAHPDWCLHIEGREKSIARDQYVLDMTRQDVRDYLFERMSAILSSANIEYVKWDFNRNLTEVGSGWLPAERRQETFHRFVLGTYELLDRLTTAFPHILLEGCSSGGGRYDPAMLYYSPQYWTSDDTDAMERVDIQLGTSMVYPASSMSCHVSACPNHQTGRMTSFRTRGHVAMGGAFGYELDLTALSDEEKELIRQQVDEYHRYYDVINRGDLYRLIMPNDTYNGKQGKCAAWIYVSVDKSEALLTFVVMRTSVKPVYFLKLQGLDPTAQYRDEESGRIYHGDTLMKVGLNLTRRYTDGDSMVVHLKKV